MERFIGIFGIIVLLGIAFLMSNNKFKINLWTVLGGLTLQIVIGFLLLRWETGVYAIEFLTAKITTFLKLSSYGSQFLFGKLADPAYFDHFGFQFAFILLPTIIFFSAFTAFLYHIGVLQRVVQLFAWIMNRLMRTSGAESLSCAANMILSQTEAPLLIRPFLNKMTPSELCAVMVGGFGTIAGSVMAAYIQMGVPGVQIIIASAMAVPASLMIAKIIYPETEVSETANSVKMPKIRMGHNLLDSIAHGISDGLHLALNVAAMLIAFIALIAFLDLLLGFFDRVIDGGWLSGEALVGGEFAGVVPGSLKNLLGTVLAPLTYVMGIPKADIHAVGHLLGLKIASNEFIAYAELAPLIKQGLISEKAGLMATYMLCGFANFSSIGIQIGGLGVLAPERRSDLARLAFRAMLGGAIVSCLTATIAGLLMPG
ncbi:MAG: NupC/NupG family nucleoside CNT transporter [Deltaproteobacteria bacterium]|nr:NupC/NupG family nucleoside CNT transporter [Deltaproteobacteria bacterium]